MFTSLTFVGWTCSLKENEVMMKGGLAAVLDKNLMYICQLVDLRCQRVLEEADWRLRLARAIGKRSPLRHILSCILCVCCA